ncbi:MAG: mycofactocin precursor MftA [Desulfobacteraceae bacterium]
MQKESPVKDQDPNQEKMSSTQTTAETPCRGILDTADIKIEEVSIDGICGVY